MACEYIRYVRIGAPAGSQNVHTTMSLKSTSLMSTAMRLRTLLLLPEIELARQIAWRRRPATPVRWKTTAWFDGPGGGGCR